MGRLKGEGMALAGLVLGYVSVALLPVILIVAAIAIPSLLRARQAANEAAAVLNLQTINAAEATYRKTGGYGDLEMLIDSSLLDESFRSTMDGYNFSIDASSSDYTATATPATINTGRYGYYSTSDSVIRYSANATLAPTGRAGQPMP